MLVHLYSCVCVCVCMCLCVCVCMCMCLCALCMCVHCFYICSASWPMKWAKGACALSVKIPVPDYCYTTGGMAGVVLCELAA